MKNLVYDNQRNLVNEEMKSSNDAPTNRCLAILSMKKIVNEIYPVLKIVNDIYPVLKIVNYI